MTFTDLSDLLERMVAALESPSVADWIAALAAALTFGVAVVALVYARGQIREAKTARQQAKELEVERAQPYVVVYSEPSEASQVIIDLVVKNYGTTAARDVKVSIDPPPARADGSSEGELVRIPELIPVLAPGQEWRTMWDSGAQRKDTELPDRHVGFVSYTGLGDEERTSEIVLDWQIYKTRHWVEVYGAHDAAKALRGMNKTMSKWNESVHGSLSVFIRDGDTKDEQLRAQREAYRTGRPVAKPENRSVVLPRPRLRRRHSQRS